MEKRHADCHFFGIPIPFCTGTESYDPIYEPVFTVDGDEVVTAPSALMLSEASNVKRYWVDLYKSKNIFSNGNNHANLLEIDPLRELLFQIFSGIENDADLPDFIRTNRPSDYEEASPRIRMSLYSPLDISLTDSAGNHTGPKEITSDGVTYTMVEEGIPGSSYYRFGDRKYLSFPGGEAIDISLDGYDAGSYTLKFQEIAVTNEGEELLSHTTFENLPVNAVTTVELSVPKEGLSKLSALRADMNGAEPGGEYEVVPVANGTATFAVSQTGAVPEGRDDGSVASDDDGEDDRSGESSSKRSASKRRASKEKSEIAGALSGWMDRLFSPGLPSAAPSGTTYEATDDAMSVLGTETQSPGQSLFRESWTASVSSIFRAGIRLLLSSPFLSRDVLSFLWNGNVPDPIRWSWGMVLPLFGRE